MRHKNKGVLMRGLLIVGSILLIQVIASTTKAAQPLKESNWLCQKQEEEVLMYAISVGKEGSPTELEITINGTVSKDFTYPCEFDAAYAAQGVPVLRCYYDKDIVKSDGTSAGKYRYNFITLMLSDINPSSSLLYEGSQATALELGFELKCDTDHVLKEPTAEGNNETEQEVLPGSV